MNRRTYRVTIKGLTGYKEFTDKHKLRGWLMNYLNKNDIVGLKIVVINRNNPTK